MKFLWRALLLVLLLIPAALLCTLLTERGNRLLLEAVQQVAPLHIQYGGGSLRGELHIRQLRYATAGVELVLDDILVALEPRCLRRSAFCFEKLQVGQLNINLIPESGDTSTSPPEPLEDAAAALFVFPAPLEAESLSIDSTRISWQGGQWQQGPAQMRVRINESRIAILSATFTNPRLELLESTVEATPQDTVMPRIDLPLELSVADLRILRPALNLNGVEHALQSLHLQGHWLNSRLLLSRLQVDGGDLGHLNLNGALEFTGNWPVEASFDAHLAQPPLAPQLHNRVIKASLGGDLQAMALTFSSPGVPTVDASGKIDILDPLLPFTATGSVTGLDDLALGKLDGIPQFLAEAKLSAPLLLSATGTLTTQHLQLRSVASVPGYQPLQVELAAQHEGGKMLIENASLTDGAGDNQLAGSGEVSFADGLRWSLALSSTGLELPPISEYAVGNLAGSLRTRGAARQESWQAEILDADLQGEINGLPARVSGFAGLADGLRLSHSELVADLNGARLTLQRDGGGNESEAGTLTVDVEELGRWLPGSSGQVHFRASLAAGGQPHRAAGTLQRFRWRDLAIDSGTLTGHYQPTADDSFTLDATLTAFKLGNINLTALHLLAEGDASDHSITLDSQGDIRGQLRVSGAVADQQWRGLLAPTRLDTALGVWELAEEVALSWSDRQQQLALASHCWRRQDNRICPNAWRLGPEGGGSLEMGGDLALLDGLLPEDIAVQGDLQLRADATWSADGNITVQGSSLVRSLLVTRQFDEGENAHAGWDQGTAGFTFDGNGLRLDAALDREDRTVLALALSLPPERAEAMAGSLHLEGLQLAVFAPFLPGFSQLEGDLSGRLALAGTVDKPLATGLLRLSAGRFALAGNPTQMNNLNLSIEAHGDGARLHGDGIFGGGPLKLVGNLETVPQLRLQLAIEGQENAVLYPPSTDMVLSENLQISVQKNHIQVTGDITVHEGTLQFEQLPEGGVALSADIVEVDYTGNVIREELPFAVTMDVRVKIKDKFKLSGSLLQTALAGELQVRQQPGEPLQLFGSLNTVGGEIRAYQRRLLIRRGVFSFAGPPDNPTVDLRADRPITGSSVTVGIQVRGPLAQDLELDIYSDPVMSQGDAISYLVRGRSMDQGASGDGTAMALSLAGGVVNRSELVSRLNSVPGVSDVSFGAEGADEEAAATVSGYIGQRIYLSYGLGIYEPINVLTARLYLRTRLWLEVVSRLENSMDLYYSFDID